MSQPDRLPGAAGDVSPVDGAAGTAGVGGRLRKSVVYRLVLAGVATVGELVERSGRAEAFVRATLGDLVSAGLVERFGHEWAPPLLAGGDAPEGPGEAAAGLAGERGASGPVVTHGGWIGDGHRVTVRVCETAARPVVWCPVAAGMAGAGRDTAPCRVVVDESGREDLTRTLPRCRLSDPGGELVGDVVLLDVPAPEPFTVSRANFPVEWRWEPRHRYALWRPVESERVYSDRWVGYLDDPAGGRREDRVRCVLAHAAWLRDTYRAVIDELGVPVVSRLAVAEEALAALRGGFIARPVVAAQLRDRAGRGGSVAELRALVLELAADIDAGAEERAE